MYLDGLLSQDGWADALPILSDALSSALPGSWHVRTTTKATEVSFRMTSAQGEIACVARSLEDVRRTCATVAEPLELVDALFFGDHKHPLRAPLTPGSVRTRRNERITGYGSATQYQIETPRTGFCAIGQERVRFSNTPRNRRLPGPSKRARDDRFERSCRLFG